jgi:hypothetical protein
MQIVVVRTQGLKTLYGSVRAVIIDRYYFIPALQRGHSRSNFFDQEADVVFFIVCGEDDRDINRRGRLQDFRINRRLAQWGRGKKLGDVLSTVVHSETHVAVFSFPLRKGKKLIEQNKSLWINTSLGVPITLENPRTKLPHAVRGVNVEVAPEIWTAL